MGNVGDYAVNGMLDAVLGDQHIGVFNETVFFSMWLTNPGNDGSGTEVEYDLVNGYQRIALDNDSVQFPDAVNGFKTNGQIIPLPNPVTSWGVCPYWAIVAEEVPDGDPPSVMFHGRLGGTSPFEFAIGSELFVPASTLAIKIRRSLIA